MPKLDSRRAGESRVREDGDFWSWADPIMVREFLLREEPKSPDLKPIDLMERTARFGEAVIRFAKKIPQNPVNSRLISQLVGAGTSVGANYCEADDSVSRKDYKKSIGTCRKESKESMFFLRMVATADETLAEEARVLWREAKELNLIFWIDMEKTMMRKPQAEIQNPTRTLESRQSFGLRTSDFGLRPSALGLSPCS